MNSRCDVVDVVRVGGWDKSAEFCTHMGDDAIVGISIINYNA